ncbi:hypothetical protein BDF14DRAFT_1730898 [Spinellus fusiger]|nr:hypothetical protein BDF14DRAFT_1730898 [Spinellus fusiger]
MLLNYGYGLLALLVISEGLIPTVLADQVNDWYFPNWNKYRKDTPAPDAHWLNEWGFPKDGEWGWPNRKSVNYDIVSDPDLSQPPNAVLRVTYPKGSRNPAHNPQGGIGFHAQPIQVSDTVTVTDLEYQVYFPKSYNFVLGGKLPGIIGGTGRCSGGVDTPTCFSARFMWRQSGKGEVYTYIPQSKQSPHLCSNSLNVCNIKCGYSIGRGSFTFKTGAWTTVRQVLKLNTPGKTDGQLTIYANGKQVFQQNNIAFRESQTDKRIAIDFETFFGGSSGLWVTPTTQYAYFKGFHLQLTSS